MKTWFYNRTAYVLLGVPVPQCFIELDEYFNTRFTTSAAMIHPSVTLAENLCRRMADIELYAWYISETQKSLDTFRAAIYIGTLLVGYFTACKSVLDAGAITLARVYSLSLSNKEMDFSKRKFWKQLQQASTTLNDRYVLFHDLFDEVIKWRDSAINRATPFVITHSPGAPDKVPRGKMEIKMIAKPDTGMSTVVVSPKSVQWVEPLHFHRKWQSRMIEFCGEICSDIRDRT